MTVAARIHGGDQHEARRIGDAMIDACNRDLAGFERPPRVERLRLEFGKFVEEENAVMRERRCGARYVKYIYENQEIWRRSAIGRVQKFAVHGLEDLVRKRFISNRPGERQGADEGRYGGNRLAPPRRFRAVRHRAGEDVE